MSRCFNSRVREGRDAYVFISYVHVWCFNSRVREGRDVTVVGIAPLKNLFQLTRPRGTRPVRLSVSIMSM